MREIRKDETTTLKIPKGFSFIGDPFRHQIVTFIYAIFHGNLAILSSMGSGKTFCGINICRFWIQSGEAERVLVVSPSSVIFNWKDEVHKFSEYRAVPLQTEKDTSREARKKLFKEDGQFYIINYEATHRYMKNLLQLDYDIIIFDESSKISNPKSKQTQACMNLAARAKFRYILNGTPISNKPIDLWSQFYVLDFGETLGEKFSSFRRIYFHTIPVRNRGKWYSIYKIRGRQSMLDIAKHISTKSIRYLKNECVKDLPEKTYQLRKLSLPKETRKLYTEVFKNAKLEVSKLDQHISANIKLTKFVKAIQITSGFLKTDEGNIIRLKNNPKLKELECLIDEILYEDAIVIWCKYLYSISLVSDLLKSKKINHLIIQGDVKNKTTVAKRFQDSSIKQIPIMISQIVAGGMGLNLHKASYAIYYENEWRLLNRLQSEDRIHRIGQLKRTTIIDMTIEDSIDELILSAIKEKKEVADYILMNLI